ncbi:MAG TPA: hypothetical protein PK299_07485 [Anaerolineales bacterium]|nr:hypothetical protein [Anaerolineales bacterium]
MENMSNKLVLTIFIVGICLLFISMFMMSPFVALSQREKQAWELTNVADIMQLKTIVADSTDNPALATSMNEKLQLAEVNSTQSAQQLELALSENGQLIAVRTIALSPTTEPYYESRPMGLMSAPDPFYPGLAKTFASYHFLSDYGGYAGLHYYRIFTGYDKQNPQTGIVTIQISKPIYDGVASNWLNYLFAHGSIRIRKVENDILVVECSDKTILYLDLTTLSWYDDESYTKTYLLGSETKPTITILPTNDLSATSTAVYSAMLTQTFRSLSPQP